MVAQPFFFKLRRQMEGRVYLYSPNCLTAREAVRFALQFPITAKPTFRTEVSSNKICGIKRGTGTGFSPSTPVSLCQ